MIFGLSSTLPTLKTLEFKPGLNVLLSSTTTSESREKTRNSAGNWAGNGGTAKPVHFNNELGYF